MLWFVRECWPQLRGKFDDAKLLVVGSCPVPSIRGLDGQDGIEVTGRVPETPPWFDRASVAIAPLHMARGVQNKVLEAMSMGLPVVATTNAAQGLAEVDEGALVVTDAADETVRALAQFISKPGDASAAGGRAAQYVREHYRWETAFRTVDGVLDRSSSSPPTPSRSPTGTGSAPGSSSAPGPSPA